MDKLKCPSFFKCRGKEVGVWGLWMCGGPGEENFKGSQVLDFAFCGYHFSTFLFNCLAVSLMCPHRVEGK